MLLEDALPTYLKGGSGHGAGGVLPLTGLVSRGAREGHWFIYPSLDMSRRLEIAETDILDFEQLSAEQSPFGRLGGTRVLVRKNAPITTARTGHAFEDEFDLDIRLGKSAAKLPHEICEGTEDGTTCAAECVGETYDCQTDACTQGCGHPTEGCPDPTVANTCNTRCKQHTCANTCGPTCHATCANTCANTCAPTCKATCANTCAATCHTCETKCQQPTCPPHCKPETVACTHVTCGNQPACKL